MKANKILGRARTATGEVVHLMVNNLALGDNGRPDSACGNVWGMYAHNARWTEDEVTCKSCIRNRPSTFRSLINEN